MKRLDLRILGGALLSLMLVTGCNNNDDNGITVEPGDKLVVTENVTMECDTPFSFKTVGSSGDAIVGVREGEGGAIQLVTEDGEVIEGQTNVTVHGGDWGIDVSYTVITPCPEPIDENITEPIVPIDGKCPIEYKVSDSDASKCVAIEVPAQLPIECGEGTELDDNSTCVPTPIEPPKECGDGLTLNHETGLCDVTPPLECDIGLIEVDGACVAKVYKLEDDECIEGYTEGDKGVFCFLDSATDKPSPK